MHKTGAYICDACAKKNGAIWPEGHCATCHETMCPYCMSQAAVCHVSDWSWPKNPNLNKYAEETREV